MNFMDELKSKATPRSREAIAELERRGLGFGAHFGTENAEAVLARMDAAFSDGTLYDFMRCEFGLSGPMAPKP
jgi:hypothetical protein